MTVRELIDALLDCPIDGDVYVELDVDDVSDEYDFDQLCVYDAKPADWGAVLKAEK